MEIKRLKSFQVTWPRSPAGFNLVIVGANMTIISCISVLMCICSVSFRSTMLGVDNFTITYNCFGMLLIMIGNLAICKYDGVTLGNF